MEGKMTTKKILVFSLIALGYFFFLFGLIDFFLFIFMAKNASCACWAVLGGVFAFWEASFLFYVYFWDASPWETLDGASITLWRVSLISFVSAFLFQIILRFDFELVEWSFIEVNSSHTKWIIFRDIGIPSENILCKPLSSSFSPSHFDSDQQVLRPLWSFFVSDSINELSRLFHYLRGWEFRPRERIGKLEVALLHIGVVHHLAILVSCHVVWFGSLLASI